jgi:enolase
VNDFTISHLAAREVLDCRGLPTVQVDVHLACGVTGTADVPAGRSIGSYESHELRDGGDRFGGFGVRQAVANVVERIAPAVIGHPADDQRGLDALLVGLDGTRDKSQLGANAIVGVSLAAARASAQTLGTSLYRYLNRNGHVLPVPLINLINGGRHASNDLDFQEFIIVPWGATNMLEALQIGTEVNLQLADVLREKYGKAALNTGDEGGFAPAIADPVEALECLHEAVSRTRYGDRIAYGLDCAATHLFDAETGTYTVAGRRLSRDELFELYERLIDEYGVITIEDPVHEDDFEGFALLTSSVDCQIVGDDLFVTNPARLEQGITRGAANSLLWKFNQIGTLSEALDAAELAHRSGYSIVVSERSGETEDPIIADLAVALNAGQIKTGAPVRGERTAKYNRLLRIEEELGESAVYGDGRLARRTSKEAALA